LIGSDDSHHDIGKRGVDERHELTNLTLSVGIDGSDKIRAEKYNHEGSSLFESTQYSRLEFILGSLIVACSELGLYKQRPNV